MGAVTVCERPERAARYRSRAAGDSPLYRLLEERFGEFERVYPGRYQARYGFWRPVVRKSVEAYLACGQLGAGFARVRCPDCAEEFFVALSCKQRCICPSCHQKRTLLTGIHVAEQLCAPVPHLQFVWTMPKRFRRIFLFNRGLLRGLPVLAWDCVKEVYGAVLDREDVVPGMIAAIQTHGSLAHWHPHLHALATAGAFTPEGTFVPLPKDLEPEPFLRLWEQKVADFLWSEGRITEQAVRKMHGWERSGFSVDMSVRLEAGDTRGLERLAQYMVRCPFSMERMISVNAAGQVVYRAEKPDAYTYPMPGDPDLRAGSSRNFEVFEPLDFLAQITQHIPPKGAQLIRYYGWYSNKSRGKRAAAANALTPTARSAHGATCGAVNAADGPAPPSRGLARMRWAALIQRVYGADPLRCPKCGATMEVISILTLRAQPAVVRRILERCGRWKEPRARPPPHPSNCNQTGQAPVQESGLHYIPIDEFLASL